MTRLPTPHRVRGHHSSSRIASALLLSFSLVACHTLTGDDALPPGAQDATQFDTPSGAVSQARAAVGKLRPALDDYIAYSAQLTDEFGRDIDAPAITENDIDRRALGATISLPYTELQQVRAQAEQARGVLRAYAPNVSRAVLGQVYAVEGLADVLLADLYCSGVPLSTIESDQDFTYRPGSFTTDVYRTAAALFDTAVTLSADSARVLAFARVGWGRALLNAGFFDSAAHVVARVPDTATVRLRVRTNKLLGNVPDREGGNGLPYRSANDPRSATTLQRDAQGLLMYSPVLYDPHVNGDSADAFLASGVEARLIEAEADLRNGGTQWLVLLNRLRTDGTFTVTTRSDIPGQSPGPANYPDTVWGAGTGVGLIPFSVVTDAAPQCEPAPAPCTDTVWYRGLYPLSDPGTGLTDQAARTARVNLLFRERAYWLFLSGHRQGDLRRLVRQYGRSQSQVYPTGSYGLRGNYGPATWLTIPDEEHLNPLYTGCLGHD